MRYYNNESLSHYGVKGQSWGVRRFQNEDGSLTAEGKARYGQSKEYTEDRGFFRGDIVRSNEGTRMGEWRQYRHEKNLKKAQEKHDTKKEAKYKSKLEAQSAANDNMKAYKRHSSTAKLMFMDGNYAHARARGSSRAASFIEATVPVVGTALRFKRDKKAYGKAIVYSAFDGVEYAGDATRE